MVTLYVDRFWISPYAFSSFVALEEKGVPFQVKEVGLDRKEHLQPGYQKSSLTGRVPALEHDGFWVTESNVMDEYVDEAFPPPQHPRLFPTDLRERARARQILCWVRTDLMPIREERATHTMFYQPTRTPLSAKGQEARAKLLEVAEALIPAGRPHLFAAWSIADADLAFMLMRLILNGDPVPPTVEAYARRQWARPSIRKFVERQRPQYVPY